MYALPSLSSVSVGTNPSVLDVLTLGASRTGAIWECGVTHQSTIGRVLGACALKDALWEGSAATGDVGWTWGRGAAGRRAKRAWNTQVSIFVFVSRNVGID